MDGSSSTPARYQFLRECTTCHHTSHGNARPGDPGAQIPGEFAQFKELLSFVIVSARTSSRGSKLCAVRLKGSPSR
jgi:hypothetical protein